jgi:hypothetical protein
MSSYGYLRVGDVLVSDLRNGVGDDLLAAFRGDMFQTRRVSEYQYYVVENNYEYSDEDKDQQIDVLEFRAPARVIADRLDMVGVTGEVVLDFLNQQFADLDTDAERFDRYGIQLPDDVSAELAEERAYMSAMTAEIWVDTLANSADDSHEPNQRQLGSRAWLLDQLYAWETTYALRIIVLAFPESEVILDVTDLVDSGDMGSGSVASLPADAVAAIGTVSGMHAPVVVLTEGSTDAEFLKAGLHVLYPHLTDVLRFLDYEAERRPEGGVSALSRMVRAFAAAGIANRIVAVFDNDAAAIEVTQALDCANLPSKVRVIHYPDSELGRSYPTLGPPNADSPMNSIALANINGLAASIEIYLGEDVLSGTDGTFFPIQWKANAV